MPPSQEEVNKTINKTSRDKSASIDSVSAGLFKMANPEILCAFLCILTNVWGEETMLKEIKYVTVPNPNA